MSKCGFCVTRNHDQCTGRSQRWIPEIKKKRYVIVMLDDYIECGCKHKSHKEVKDEAGN